MTGILHWGVGRQTEVIVYQKKQTDLRVGLSRLVRITVLVVLAALAFCAVCALYGKSEILQSPNLPSEELQRLKQSDVQISQSLIDSLFISTKIESNVFDKEKSHDRGGFLPKFKFVSRDESTKLWDLPEIKRYQAIIEIFCTMIESLVLMFAICSGPARAWWILEQR